jgi:Flp pilus assembly protein TadD
VLSVLLAVAVLALFWPALGNDFVNYDDDLYVTRNPRVQQGLTSAGVRWAFTTDAAGNWHPLTWLSHQLDWELWGPSPRGHHATSVALHVVNTLLVFWLLDAMTGAPWRSALVAAVFGVHPLHVESVAWVAERKDVLSTCLWLLTTLAYVAWTRRRGTGRYLAVVGGLALGLMAKPMLVTLPFTLLLLDWWPLGRLRKQTDVRPLVLEKLPLFALVAASSVVTWIVQSAAGVMAPLPLATRVGHAAITYVAYLGKMVWPLHLSAIYPHPARAPLEAVVPSALLLALVTAVAVWQRRKRPYLLVGWLWYLGTLVPVIGLVQVGASAMADRFTYVPLLGIFVALAWLVPAGPEPRLVGGSGLCGAGAAGGADVGADRRLARLDDALRARARRRRAKRDRTREPRRGARRTRRPGHGDDAPRAGARAATGPGHRAYRTREHAHAARDGRGGHRALPRRRRGGPVVRPARSTTSDTRSSSSAASTRRSRASRRRCASTRTSRPRTTTLGMALARRGDSSEARAEFERAVAADPRYAEANNNLAAMLLSEGRLQDGLTHAERAIAVQPAFAEAHANRIAALIRLGRLADAWAAVRAARAAGVAPPQWLVDALAERMPAPSR